MPAPGRRRTTLLVLVTMAGLLSASMLAPAFGAPRAVTAVSLAKKLSRTLKIAKRADKNAKRAIAGLQVAGADGKPGAPGAPGATGPAGAPGGKGDKGDPGTASNQGAPGPKGDKGDKGDTGDPGGPGPKGDTGDPGAKGDTGNTGDPGAKGDKGDKGDQGIQGIQGNPGSAGVADSTVQFVTFSVPGGSSGTSQIVDCPAGQNHILGGGYEIADAVGNLANVMQTRPLLGEDGWVVRVRSGAANAFNVTAYAVCG
jgi:Collagen triple helix repeat (20 copies)